MILRFYGSSLVLFVILLLASCRDESEITKNPETNFWISKAKFPAGSLTESVSFTIGKNLYVGTGLNGNVNADLNNNYINKFYVYNIDEDAWKEIASLPSDKRSSAISFSIGSYGYVGLGINCLGSGNCAYSSFNDLWRYDPANDSWDKMADFPGAHSGYETAFVIGDMAYIVDGQSIGDNDTWEYNTISNEWNKKSSYPGLCSSRAVSFSLDGLGYVGFGWGGGSFTCDEFWEYDPIGDTWIQKQDFPGKARYDASAFSMMGKGYLACGVYQESSDQKYLNDIWVYDNVNDRWTQINTSYPGKGRVNLIGGVIENRLILGLGSDNSFGRPYYGFDDVWEYLP